MLSISYVCLLIVKVIVLTSAEIPPGNTENETSVLTESDKQQNLNTLEQLVETNKQANVLWAVIKKYNTLDTRNINETCISDLLKDDRIVPFYLVNLTLVKTSDVISGFTRNRLWRNGKKKTDAQAVYDKRMDVTSDVEIYISMIKSMIGESLDEGENICISSSFCGCISRYNLDDFTSEFSDYKEVTHKIWKFIVFGSYVEPFFIIIIIGIGMILNSVLLLIFLREKSIRSESNILIFNLVVSNIVMLLVYIPSNYINKYESAREGHEFTAIEVLVTSANALTILFLNIQRFFEVSRVLNSSGRNCVSSPVWKCVIYLSVLWSWNIIFATLLGIVDPMVGQIFEMFLHFLVYTFIFSIVLSVFNSMTARKLHRAAKEGKTSTEFQHILGSGLVLSLTIVYYSIHIPFYIYRVFEVVLTDSVSYMFVPITYSIIIFILHLTFFAYPCINMIVLYKASGTYRTHFNKYLFRCWYSPGESKYVTMSSVRNIEAEE